MCFRSAPEQAPLLRCNSSKMQTVRAFGVNVDHAESPGPTKIRRLGHRPRHPCRQAGSRADVRIRDRALQASRGRCLPERKGEGRERARRATRGRRVKRVIQACPATRSCRTSVTAHRTGRRSRVRARPGSDRSAAGPHHSSGVGFVAALSSSIPIDGNQWQGAFKNLTANPATIRHTRSGRRRRPEGHRGLHLRILTDPA